jgi:hypothetical protein
VSALATCSCPSLPILLSKIQPHRCERKLVLRTTGSNPGLILPALLSIFRAVFLRCSPVPPVAPILCPSSHFFAPDRMVGLGRLELPTSPLSGVRSNHLSYRPNLLGPEGWWSWSGSNRRPPECKSGALPAELQPLLAERKNILEADWTRARF